ncbi:hypothetical protein Pyrfu_0476 [Pyrolobus fumarii 1A]|uniref:Uncharacterized protein n=1 Tax=Pyrolobus fumarii (strain DSM 11204 / 1A) TaxID=694429 RepID=G0EGH3_PYRF1|nr:hypothetical protein Pyrfu_0476 [Pyrolobus fumarii 1A]
MRVDGLAMCEPLLSKAGIAGLLVCCDPRDVTERLVAGIAGCWAPVGVSTRRLQGSVGNRVQGYRCVPHSLAARGAYLLTVGLAGYHVAPRMRPQGVMIVVFCPPRRVGLLFGGLTVVFLLGDCGGRCCRDAGWEEEGGCDTQGCCGGGGVG